MRDNPKGSAPDRVTTTTYDNAGRVLQAAVSGGQGTAVPTVTNSYSPTTGRLTTTSSSAGTITRGYDAIGRQTSYTDAAGVTSTTEYDLLGRPTSIWDGKGTTGFAYEPVSGRLATVAHLGIGTFTAEDYDADGNITQELAPNGLRTNFAYDAAGNATGKAYSEDGCSIGCADLDFAAAYSVHGQVRGDLSTSSAAGTSALGYTYDAAGRLTRVTDDIAGQCTTRHYAFDADSNRTSSRSVEPLSGGACDTGPGGITTSHSYDEADRLIDAGYDYDAFGRTTSVPAGDAGGSALTSTYFADDMVRSMTQGGETRTFELDPARRVLMRESTGEPDETYHYSDESDSPAWIERDDSAESWERYVGSASGMLGATQTGEDDTATGVTFQLTNLHGDVVAETDAGGDITASFDADEFGVPTSGGLPDSGFGWLGGNERRAQFDSGVITMGVRVYVPQTGRFLQTDPVVGGSANDYDYGNQDPRNQRDLNGESAGYGPGVSGYIFGGTQVDRVRIFRKCQTAWYRSKPDYCRRVQRSGWTPWQMFRDIAKGCVYGRVFDFGKDAWNHVKKKSGAKPIRKLVKEGIGVGVRKSSWQGMVGGCIWDGVTGELPP